MSRAVTELDFRKEEFRDAKVEDYEFRREDKKLVRKDRWETGIHSIRVAFGLGGNFEISEVIEEARRLAQLENDWHTTEDYVHPSEGAVRTLKLVDGSVLRKAYCGPDKAWTWQGIPVGIEVVGWRTEEETSSDELEALAEVIPN